MKGSGLHGSKGLRSGINFRLPFASEHRLGEASGMVTPSEGVEDRPLVGIAGASGFVGSFLRTELGDDFRFRGLTRSPTVAGRDFDGVTEWKHCDLFSLPKVTEALEGCDYAFYLVHSMSPSSRLVQGNFADLDLLLADNFIRAAEAAGVRQVVYLGGLLPADPEEGISPHLRSRWEVEKVLRSRSVPVTALRAGLIFGPGGSSFTLLIRLVKRLPFMILPRWVRSQTHSIDIMDVVKAFRLSVTRGEFTNGVFDLGGHEAMTYRELIVRTSRGLRRRVRFVNFPFNAFALSRRWVSCFGGVPADLVGPLLESLSHDLCARPNPLMDQIRETAVPFEESLRRSVDDEGNPLPNPRKEVIQKDRPNIRKARLVRSVQRMPLPTGWDAEKVSDEYGKWLSERFWGMLKVSREDKGAITFRCRWPSLLLLRLVPTPYSEGSSRRRAYYVNGGVLAGTPDPPGRFEFRIFPEEGFLVAAIHGFEPRLPWWIYSVTQARVHLWVMRRFGRYLGSLGGSRSR